jgi:muramoyltetrapeptide carboxypeptidase LdcA involved in peptidoglycan recycling
MKSFVSLRKLQEGDKVAILSPSFAAPGEWPEVYELGLMRLREVFGLEAVEFPTTRKVGASKRERSRDLIAAFENQEIKGIITSIGGDDQVTYVKDLPPGPFIQNPKPFFGYSDNTHFMNFLWLHGIPSYYGGALFTQFAEQSRMHAFTLKYLNFALFQEGELEIEASEEFNDVDLDWYEPGNLAKERSYEPNEGWYWDGERNAEGITWGGTLESIDEILRHGVEIPALEDFERIILITETSEEIPTHDYVFRVYRAFGERGILERVQAILVGRPKAWGFDHQVDEQAKANHRSQQRETILEVVRKYNPSVPVVQNLDFGHTDPQIPLPYGQPVRLDCETKTIFAKF